MKLRGVVIPVGASICILSLPVIAQTSNDWVRIDKPNELRALYSDKTFKGKDGWGVSWIAHYRADGKGILIRGQGLRFPRTWEIKGGDQVCVTEERGVTCYTFERHRENSNQIRARKVHDKHADYFTVEDGVPQF